MSVFHLYSFDARGRFARLAVAMQQAGKQWGFGVDEDTALYIVNGIASVVGNSGVWIIDLSAATFINEEYFRMENIEVAYLTEGDAFILETKELLPGKPPLIPSNDTVYSSSDIFGPNEGIKSIFALVNADTVSSVGLSYELDPTAQVTFRKASNTEAYFKDGKYAIGRLFMDISTGTGDRRQTKN